MTTALTESTEASSARSAVQLATELLGGAACCTAKWQPKRMHTS